MICGGDETAALPLAGCFNYNAELAGVVICQCAMCVPVS